MFNVDEIDSYSHKPNSVVNVVDVSSNDETTYKFTTDAKANISPEIASEQTTVASNVILLKTAKGVAVSSDKKLAARIFFDEGSQRSYVRSGFASQLGLNPISCELLSVSGFGGTVTQHNYGVTEIGLETPQGIEHVRVLITEEIVQPLDHSGYSEFKSHPRLQGLTLANDFEEDKFVVDILLGADAAYRFLGEIIQDNSQPLIQESHFGDVLYGPWSQNAMLTTAIIDSEISLYWLSSTRKLKQFVQNKVDAINRLFDSSLWGHTASDENPADIVSRGCSAQSLQRSPLWSQGPSWITEEALWPKWPKAQPPTITTLIAVAEQQLSETLIRPSVCNVIELERFNHYSRLLASTVYVRRFCSRTRIKEPPSTAELETAELEWILSQQHQHFATVLTYLTSSSSSSFEHAPAIVRQLNLFLDEKGIIRTKGRFDFDSSLILLPQHSRFTDLLILDNHQQLHHIGVGGTIVALRKRFWVPSARSATRNLLRKCLKCKRVTGRHYPLPMSAELPTFRVDTSSRPFSNIGADSLCRAAVVRTSKGCTTRSIVKLYPLEVQAGSHSTPEESTENNEEHSNENTRPQRKAAFVARDAIHAQLIDNLLD
eukprot:gene542-biopygen7104